MKKVKRRWIALLCMMMAVAIGLFTLGMTACGDTTVPSGSEKVDDKALSEYTVVYPVKDEVAKSIAEEFCASVKDKYSVELACVSDKTEEQDNEILFGNTSRLRVSSFDSGKYTVSSKSGKVQLSSDTSSGLIAAAQRLFSDISVGKAKYSSPVTEEYTDVSLRVMSFNVLTADVTPRIERVKSVIERNNPDILGVQEASKDWFSVFQMFRGYGCVGVARDPGGTGEACFVLYKENKFTLIDSGTRWYTDTPDVPSVLEGSTYRRIYTYALLERKVDGMRFLYVNTHLHLHLENRLIASGLLLDFLNEKYPGIPTYITGDFNTDAPKDGPNGYDDFDYRLEQGGFRSTRLVAPETDDHTTYPTDLYARDATHDALIIDYCMIRDCDASDIIATRYRVDTAPPDKTTHTAGLGEAASDHYPIVADTLLYTRFR